MDKVRLGMVGAGFAARTHLANNFAKLRGVKVEVPAIVARTSDGAERMAREFNIPSAYTDYRRLLERKDIDVIDLCTPTNLHEEMIVAAADEGKHIICEKPLTGYFGEDVEGEDVGFRVPRDKMLKAALESCARIREAVERNHILFSYAEDWIYAPPITKLKRIVKAARGTILDMRAEESHSGSHAAYSRKWKNSGGGALLRVGSHPIATMIHLKAYEGQLRDGKPIQPKSVAAEAGRQTRIPSFQREPKKWLVDSWENVEDWFAAIITFEDGSKGIVYSSDGILGGVRKWMQVFLSNTVVFAGINPNNAVQVYAPDPGIFGEEYINEKLSTKAGWNYPSPDEDWMGGYPQELEDFINSILQSRRPVSGLDLAEDTVKVIYSAYVAAEKGQRVSI